MSGDVRAQVARAQALRTAGDVNGAVAALARAARDHPREPDAWMALGGLLMEIAVARPAGAGAKIAPLDAAQQAFAQAVALAPRAPAVLASAAMAARYACDWPRSEALLVELRGLLDAGERAPIPPLIAVALLDDPAQLLATARDHAGAQPHARAPAVVRRGDRLRVGYLSADFHEHATAYLAAGLFERHDRARVETFAYALDRDDGGPMRARLKRAFAHWRDVRELDDDAAARTIRDDALDVLVDLKGHTQGSRLGILARRPAAVQIHYLGFPGTLAHPGIDALVADATVVPEGDERHFAERVLRLPGCYQVNDRDRPLPPAPSRASVGLPDDALVLCSFNQAYKLTRPLVALWLDVLARHGDAVLWLNVPHASAQRQLRAFAAARGVAPERVVFAGYAKQEEHLARLRCADLALDVLPYGSHTTGSDALWCGVPLLTATGATFAGRVGTSLVRAAGLPQFAAPTLDAYAERLEALVARRDALREAQAHLERERRRLPLFDTDAFARAFEALLQQAANGAA
ncbi:MAG TPA: tetratricopeptide repeat protein [Casimicrobiaceae bacterium]|nr:tetratricopeptide repeat protein [Casimicrobiaceae bacterium]